MKTKAALLLALLALPGCTGQGVKYQAWLDLEKARLKEQGKTDRAMLRQRSMATANEKKRKEQQQPLPTTTTITTTAPFEIIDFDGQQTLNPETTVKRTEVDTEAVALQAMRDVAIKAMELAAGSVHGSLHGNMLHAGKTDGGRIVYASSAPPESEAAQVIKAAGDAVPDWLKDVGLAWIAGDTIKGVAGIAGQIGDNVSGSFNDQSLRMTEIKEVQE